MTTTAAQRKRYDLSEKGRARKRRYNESEKGRASKRKWKEKKLEDPIWRIEHSLLTASCNRARALRELRERVERNVV